jgi:hypothetical protein
VDKEQLKSLIGKRVIVRLKAGPRLFGTLQESTVSPGYFDATDASPDAGNTHNMFMPDDAVSVTESTPEEEQALRDACTCRGSQDPMAWTNCPVHRMNAPPTS